MRNSDANASTGADARPRAGVRPALAQATAAGSADAGKARSVEIDALRADLARLDTLLADAVATLLGSFGEIDALCGGQAAFAAPLERAATALQFQDLASQLIAHVRDRLTGCTHLAPARYLRQPVSQSHLAEGSIELFQGDTP